MTTQSLKITNQTTQAQVLRYFKKEYAKEDLKEVAKYKFDQMRYNPSAETFRGFLNKFKKVAKQASGDKSSDITETFLFAKLPVQMPNELAMAGKHDASREEIRTFVQRRCQHAQLIPNTTSAKPFNQISAPQPNVAAPQTSNAQPQQNKETKREFDGQCRHCGLHGHKWANAENASGRKHKPNLRAKPRNNQRNPPKLRRSGQNTTPNLCAKSLTRWDIPLETATTGIRRRQPTEASRTLSSRPRKTDNSEGISNRPTAGSTTQTNCPTPPTMRPTMLRKQNDTMT